MQLYTAFIRESTNSKLPQKCLKHNTNQENRDKHDRCSQETGVECEL